MKLTDEMTEAACRRTFPSWGEFTENFKSGLRAGMKDALTAALAAMPQPETVAVKPLWWRVFCSRSGNSEAKMPFGEYVIQSETEGWCLYLPGKEDADASYSTIDAAKAAAQADYEARVLSALTTPPRDDRDAEIERLRKALTDAWKAMASDDFEIDLEMVELMAHGTLAEQITELMKQRDVAEAKIAKAVEAMAAIANGAPTAWKKTPDELRVYARAALASIRDPA